ncbi:DUF4833 domain-containing protein [Myxococcaceae bacterium GXIMD 01537]
MMLAPPLALAGPAPAPRGVDSLFFIARSENRNQVHYALRVGEDCAPVGTSPVHAYWRMFEKGPTAVEGLLGLEEPVYGLGDEQRVTATPEGWRVRVYLRSASNRPIEVAVSREEGRCVTRAWTKVAGEEVLVDHIFVQNLWPFGIGEVSLHATGQDGRAVRDTIRQ